MHYASLLATPSLLKYKTALNAKDEPQAHHSIYTQECRTGKTSLLFIHFVPYLKVMW